MERKLASVQEIAELEPIIGAYNIENARILGWSLCVRKNEFHVGSKCVYFEPDSLIPRYPWSSFLFKDDKESFARLRVRKMKGVVSYGLAIPYETVFGAEKKYSVGDDVTEILGVKKYEFVPPEHLKGKVSGVFPSFIKKTDEIRLQAVPSVLDRHRDRIFYYTEKMDGSSQTCFINNGEFGVCSRNNKYFIDDDNAFCKTARNYGIESKLRLAGFNVAIQSEILSPGIQKNKYKFNELQMFTFNVWDIDNQKYLDYPDFINFCKELDIQTVPIIDDNFSLQQLTCDDLIELAKGESRLAKIQREGIVFRPIKECVDYELGRLSFKCINPNYLLKYEQ